MALYQCTECKKTADTGPQKYCAPGVPCREKNPVCCDKDMMEIN